MTHHNFDEPIQRLGSDCSKWSQYGDDVLPLWIADMDFRSPEPVIEALRGRIDQGVFGYGGAMAELAEVVCERLRRLYRWDVAPKDFLFLPELVGGMNLACRAVGGPGDGVLIQTPIYPPFLSAPEYSGRTRELVSLRRGAVRYEIDFDAFERAITPRTRLFMLCNPHNPVGRVYERWELERLADICLRHDLWICSDEIHCDLLFDGRRHIPIASLSPEVAARTVTLMSPSKTFNLPGLRCGFAIAPNHDLLRQMRMAGMGLVSPVNVLGYVAAIAAYRDGQPWLDDLLAYLQANRDALVRFVQTEMPSVHMTTPEATYLAWLDCRDTGITGTPYHFFLREAKVALGNGPEYGGDGEGFVRLNFGCTRATLMQALEQMRGALARLPMKISAV